MKNILRELRQYILKLLVIIVGKKCHITMKKTLIIAPHPDDETFGCAGMIRKKIVDGAEVNVIFLTNGEKSLKDVPPKEIAQIRKKNAINALKVLGVNKEHIFWLECSDGDIPRRGSQRFEETKEKLVAILKYVEAEEVFSTNIREGWSDHLAAYELAVEAVKNVEYKIDLYLYWVWVWYYVGIMQMSSLPWKRLYLLSIQDVFREKQDALQVYFESRTPNGDFYMGELPPVFLKAFQWKYEVFERVSLDEV